MEMLRIAYIVYPDNAKPPILQTNQLLTQQIFTLDPTHGSPSCLTTSPPGR